MFKSISIVIGFIAVMIMPIAAAEIESHDASPGFIKQITGCYKRAPAALLARIGNPRILASKDFATTAKLAEDIGLRAGVFANQQFTFGQQSLRGFAFGGSDYARVQRAVIYIESTLSTDHPNYVCDVVLHELAHLYDYPPSSSPAAPKQSDGENFAKAFKQDIADIDKKRSTTKEMRETVEKHKHYMSNSREAFAEAVTRIIFLHPNMKPYKIYAALFPNVMSFVRKQLIDDGIIRTDHKGDAQIAREFERKRR